MGLPARLYDFQPSTPAKSGEVDNEFNQWVNLFNGTTQGQSIRVRNNDTGFAVARFDALGASGSILELYKSGVSVLDFLNSGQMKSRVATGTPPIDVDSVTKCPNLNADLLDDFTSGDFAKLANHGTGWSGSWFYDIPPAAVESTESQGRLIVPENTAFQTVFIKVVFAGGSHTGGTVLTWTIKRRNSAGVAQADIATISLNDTNNTINVLYNANQVTSLSEGDQIYPVLTTRTGSPTETLITIAVSGNQRLRAVA